jgi:hypothetical protein
MIYNKEISDYLEQIDFQPPDKEAPYLYTYLHNNLYQTDLKYKIEGWVDENYKTPKYFKLVLKMIQDVKHYNSSLF